MNQANDTKRIDGRARRARGVASSQPGYSLIEMLVAVTIASLVLTSVAVALHSLFRVDQHLRREVVQSTSLSRISFQLRSDAHEANSATLDQTGEGRPRLVLTYTEGRTVTYAAEEARIVRLVQQDEKVQHREVFYLSERTTVSCRTENVEEKTLVILEFVYHKGAIEGAPDAERMQRIEAVVAMDGDYTNAGP